MTNSEVPSELWREYQREFWAAEQALARLIRKLETLRGWRASLARDAAWEALGTLYDQAMWEAFHLPYMPANFKHWRDRERDIDIL
jgi:hypothetical protein